MPDNDPELPAIYEVRLTEPAEMEVDAVYLGWIQSGLQVAEQRYAGLLRALDSLSQFPGRFAFAPESEALGGGVRQMLYGKGRYIYRVLYRVIEPAGQEPGIVRVLHVRHASQRPIGASDG
jgi:plasmid stabilization system protein ParE